MATSTLVRNNGSRQRKPVLTEAKLRRIIRDELARQVLIQEGFLDFIKTPFQKLGKKAKEWVMEKTKEFLDKIKSIPANAFKAPENFSEASKLFVDSLKEQGISVSTNAEGGISAMSAAKLAKSEENLQNLEKGLEAVSLENISQSPTQKNESYNFYDLKTSIILAEEAHLQKRQKNLLKEELVTAAIATGALFLTAAKVLMGAWWTIVKFGAGIFGTLNLAFTILGKIFKFFGKDKVAADCVATAHEIHHFERMFLSAAVYPAPVQYAAYVAASGLKKGVAKMKGKETEKFLSYAEFNSPEHAEEKEAAQDLCHVMLMVAIIVEAAGHVAHAAHDALSGIWKSFSGLHASAEIGVETAGAAHAAGGALRAGTHIVKGIARAAASQV